jgi:hypothetical protein
VAHPSRYAAALLTTASLVGCSSPQAKPLLEPLSVHVTAANSSQPVRFTMEVTGGAAEFNTPELRGRAGEPSLTASTPAELVLAPGATGASFRGVDGARLEVTAVTSRARLTADGARVQIASTRSGLSIRDF